VLLGNKKGNYTWLPYANSGFFVTGEIQKLRMIKNKNNTSAIITVLNNAAPKLFTSNE
jgi:hypothetical protein